MIALSVLMILVAPFIPHHHHQGVACVVMKLCEQDEVYNDHHTAHDNADDTDAHSNSCIEDASCLKASANENLSIKQRTLLPILAVVVNTWLELDNVNYSLSKKRPILYADGYKSCELLGSLALRAPPTQFI